jgi:BirA family biotin operon repressor/biotin-[acetyl-CoA-carboxylase] ligase
MFSLLLRPALQPDSAGLLSLLAGVAMSQAASRLSGEAVGCKWPNDLLVLRRKIGGILAESSVSAGSLEHVVVGIGVNVGGPPLEVPEAGALEGVDTAELLEAFLMRFRQRYAPAEPGFSARVLELARERSVTLGRRVRATALDGRAIEGLALDLDERGGLVVDTGAERTTVAFGDVEHLDPAHAPDLPSSPRRDSRPDPA